MPPDWAAGAGIRRSWLGRPELEHPAERRWDIEKAYTFFRDGHYFEPTGKVSRGKLNALAKAMESLGDLPGALDVDKLILPGVTQMTD
jgi:hypothetical protein